MPNILPGHPRHDTLQPPSMNDGSANKLPEPLHNNVMTVLSVHTAIASMCMNGLSRLITAASMTAARRSEGSLLACPWAPCATCTHKPWQCGYGKLRAPCATCTHTPWQSGYRKARDLQWFVLVVKVLCWVMHQDPNFMWVTVPGEPPSTRAYPMEEASGLEARQIVVGTRSQHPYKAVVVPFPHQHQPQ